MNNLQQIAIFYTNKYIIEIYCSEDSIVNLPNDLESSISNLVYAKDIVAYIEKIYGIKQIIVKDIHNTTLIASNKGD